MNRNAHTTRHFCFLLVISLLAVSLFGTALISGAYNSDGVAQDLSLVSKQTATTEQTGPKASNVYYYCTKNITPSIDIKNFGDGSFYTKAPISEAAVFTLEYTTPIAGLYIIWDDIPGEWTVHAGEQAVICGQNNFIHEYVDLVKLFGSAQTKVSLDLPAGSVVDEFYAYTEGVLPSDVQVWETPCEQADILLFPTHGDDEQLFFGGIMPYYAGELGYKVQVAYMTNHKYTEKVRVHEQLNGLWKVGVHYYPVFGDFWDLYAANLDEAIGIYGTTPIEKWQVETIRRFKPYVVVGHDFAGEYGHGAHILNATELALAVVDAADETKFPESAVKYGTWDTQKFYVHKYAENTIYMDWANITLDAFDGKTALEMAKLGYKCHESQQWCYFEVMTDGYGDCRMFGLYRTIVGPDVLKNDLLENVIFETEPEPTIPPTEEPVETPTADVSATDVPGEGIERDNGLGDGAKNVITVIIVCATIVIVAIAVVKVVRDKKKQH